MKSQGEEEKIGRGYREEEEEEEEEEVVEGLFEDITRGDWAKKKAGERGEKLRGYEIRANKK